MWNRVLSDEVEESCRHHRRRRPDDIEDILKDIRDAVDDIRECTCEEIVPLLRRILNAVDEEDGKCHHHRG